MDDLLDTIHYRQLSFPIYIHDEIIYTIIAGKLVKLDCDRRNYRDFVRDNLDRILDNLERFQITDDSYLEYFNNNGYIDLRLVCKGRLLKVFLVNDRAQVNINSILADCKQIVNIYSQKYLSKEVNM